MKRRTSLALVLSGLLAAGCIDDPSGPEPDLDVGEGEAAVLGLSVFYSSLASRLIALDDAEDGARATGPQAAPVPLSASVTTTEACERGGRLTTEATLAGFVDEEAEAIELDFTITQSHEMCEMTADGLDFTLDGVPNLVTELRFATIDPTTLELTGSITGIVRVTLGGQAGYCEMAVALAGVQEVDGRGVYAMAGTVCGERVTKTVIEEPTGTS